MSTVYVTAAEAKKMGFKVPSKYHNTKTEVDGIRFDSKKEANRYCELKLLERQGLIANLELQPVFVLQEGKGLTIKYKADFRYLEPDGNYVVEDVKSKGTMTAVYRLKKKLLLKQYPGLDFREV